jgi:hypothetical protein
LNSTIISKQKFTNVIRASFPQDAGPARRSFEDITDIMYGIGDENYMKTIDIMNRCKSDPELKELMKAVL